MFRRQRCRVDGNRRGALVAEPLESRRLLTVGPLTGYESSAASTLDDTPWLRPASLAGRDEEAVAALAAEAAAGSNIQTMTWRGQATSVVAGRWIVKFDASLGEAAGPNLATRLAALDDPSYRVVGHLGANNTFLIEAPPAVSLDQITQVLSGVSGFRFAEPDTLLTTMAVPNDPSYSSMWALNNVGQTGGLFDADIDAPEAWEIHTGSGNTVVAILDSGINYNHVDLRDNVWINPGEIAFNGIDDDGNGYVDDVHGYDFVNGDGDPWDDDGHGTAVAGLVGAVGNNGVGIAGVNWNVQLMSLKVVSSGDRLTVSGAIAAFEYVNTMKRDYGINVVVTNNSYGVPYSEALREAMADGAPLGILHTASAGNQSHDNDIVPQYPATYGLDNIISVAATDHRDQRASFTSYGPTTVQLAAPGVSNRTTSHTGGYRNFSGTSGSSPHVAGAIALLADAFPHATYEEVRDAIYAGATRIPSLTGFTLTGGRLNLAGAMNEMGLRVIDATPGFDTVVTSLPTDFTVRLRPAFDPSSVDPGDLMVNSIPADSVTVSGDTITFHFNASPVTTEGLQTIEMAGGAIQRQSDGLGNTPFSTTFRYDATPLHVVSVEPANGSVATLPLGQIEIAFNEAVDPISLGLDDLNLSQGAVVGFSVVAPDRVAYQIAGIQHDGTLQWRMKPAAVSDAHGNPNSEFSGNFDLDVVQAFAPDFERIGPDGGLVFASQGLPGLIHAAGDVDEYSFFVEGGQTLSVLIDVDSAGHTFHAELLGLPIAVSASTTSERIVLEPVMVAQDATLTLRISGDSRAAYRIDLYRNATVHVAAAAVNVDDSYVDLGNGGRWGFVRHATGSSSNVAEYTVDLAGVDGHTVDVAIEGIGGADVSQAAIQLWSPSGDLVASGTGALRDIAIDEPGLHRLFIVAPPNSSYAGAITDRLALELEWNDDPLIDPVRSLDDVRGVLGYVDNVPREGIFEFVIDLSETSLQLEGGVLIGGDLVPLEPQAPGSLVIDISGSFQVDVSSGRLRFLPGLTVDTASHPGSFQPGFAPASVAGQIALLDPPVFLAARDLQMGLIGADVPVDGQGNFAGTDVTLQLGGVIDVFGAGLISESVGGELHLENDLALAGRLEQTATHLRLTVPIHTHIVLPVFGPFGGVLSVVGQIVAEARLPQPWDTYELTLSEGQALTLGTQALIAQGLSTPQNTLNTRVRIHDASGNLLASNHGSGGGPDALLTFVAPADGVYRVVVEALSGAGEYLLSVDEVAPARIDGPELLLGNQVGTFYLSAISPNPANQAGLFTYELDWDGDGTIDEIVTGGQTTSVEHAFDSSGWFDVTVVARDLDGAFSGSGSHQVLVVNAQVRPDAETPGQFNLHWTGTPGADHVEIVEAAPDLVLIRVIQVDGVTLDPALRIFNSQVNGRIFADGLGGDDVIDASGLVTIPIEIQGGTGNDRLLGGAAIDIIFGDPDGPQADGAEGRDWIDGGGGDDVIYGDGAEGAADTIQGNAGNDLIFAGRDGAEGMADQVTGGDGSDLIVDYGYRGRLNGGQGDDIVVTGSDGGEGRAHANWKYDNEVLLEMPNRVERSGKASSGLLAIETSAVAPVVQSDPNLDHVDEALASPDLAAHEIPWSASNLDTTTSHRPGKPRVSADHDEWYAYTLLQETFARWEHNEDLADVLDPIGWSSPS